MAEAVAIKTEPKVTVSYAEPIAEQRAALSTKKIDLDGAITNLLQHEKTARLGGDIAGTTDWSPERSNGLSDLAGIRFQLPHPRSCARNRLPKRHG